MVSIHVNVYIDSCKVIAHICIGLGYSIYDCSYMSYKINTGM